MCIMAIKLSVMKRYLFKDKLLFNVFQSILIKVYSSLLCIYEGESLEENFLRMVVCNCFTKHNLVHF